MAGFSGGSLRQGAKIRNSQGSDATLSKSVDLGGRYRMFIPTFYVEESTDMVDDGNGGTMPVTTPAYADVRAAVVPGRTGDYEVIDTSFIPYTEEMYKRDPITGAADDLTPLKDWARIAGVLFEAQCRREKAAAEDEARKSADGFGRDIDQVALQRSLESIELKYHGGKAANGQNIMPDKSQAISNNIVFKISTRVALVKIDAKNNPDWTTLKYCVFEISKARTDEILALLENPDYCDPKCGYLEVGYDYIGADKKTAGQNAKLQGIADSLSLAKLFPNEWNAQGKAFVENIVRGTDQEQVDFLRSRNRAFKSGKTPSEVIQSFRKWCSTNQAVFINIDFENENVVKAASVFLESHLLDGMNKIKDRFATLAEEAKKKESAATEATEATGAVPAEQTAQAAEPAAGCAPVQEVPEQTFDAGATADAIAKFASGDASTATLKNLAEQADGLNIDSGDLGDL